MAKKKGARWKKFARQMLKEFKKKQRKKLRIRLYAELERIRHETVFKRLRLETATRSHNAGVSPKMFLVVVLLCRYDDRLQKKLVDKLGKRSTPTPKNHACHIMTTAVLKASLRKLDKLHLKGRKKLRRELK